MKKVNWLTKMKMDKAVNEIKKHIDEIIEENAVLSSRLSDFNKGEEIQKVKAEFKKFLKRSIHTVSDSEERKVEKFIEKHDDKCNLEKMYRYIIYPTPLGNVVQIECLTCDEKEDISDYGDW